MTRLIHLNGPPGIGKSTHARRYVAEHPGVLNCDIDVLRTLIGGWEDDFLMAGSLIRPAALAMIGAYLAAGHDVVLPQMLVDPLQVVLFSGCATDVGAEFVERFLMDTADSSVLRFAQRGRREAHDLSPGPSPNSLPSFSPDPWHDQVRAIVAANGGEAELRRCHAGLERLLFDRPDAVVIASASGAIGDTYDRLVASLR